MRVVIADLKGRGGFVNKDTVVGGDGSRFVGNTWTSRWIERVRRLFQNVPSIHCGYRAASFERAGHDVRITKAYYVDGEIALMLRRLVVYNHAIECGQKLTRRFATRVGF